MCVCVLGGGGGKRPNDHVKDSSEHLCTLTNVLVQLCSSQYCCEEEHIFLYLTVSPAYECERERERGGGGGGGTS